MIYYYLLYTKFCDQYCILLKPLVFLFSIVYKVIFGFLSI